MNYYWQAVFEQEPMVVAWELFVLFTTLMFISIIFRLSRIERNQQIILTIVSKNKKPRLVKKDREYNKSLLWWIRKRQESPLNDFEVVYDSKDE
tara:strand:- start:7 stop:288 length:282 start_codon:yes stop_codon:yes gene_type:complete